MCSELQHIKVICRSGISLIKVADNLNRGRNTRPTYLSRESTFDGLHHLCLTRIFRVVVFLCFNEKVFFGLSDKMYRKHFFGFDNLTRTF
jgi:hypothetical protein